MQFGLLARTAIAALGTLALTTFAADAPKHTNHLANEKSPYLLQHAHNPVDWYPWGPEAFAEAKKQNKPIFLSVGYSTCHWCHVMERESFENEVLAKLINDTCIPIKVDREERPDVDRVYMAYVQASTGSGGWPMNVFLTPDLKPFFGGTYFPPQDRDGMPGLTTVLTRVKETWATDRNKVETTAGKITDAIKELSAPIAAKSGAPDAALDQSRLTKAFDALKKQFDSEHGGFDAAPKFPSPVNLNFLFHYAARSKDPAPHDMALKTLNAMTAGGIHDHLGGGFHRYSTDPRWFLPHFEKMLNDQAQLASSYLDAYQVTRDESYATVARDILDYVLRDLTGEGGQFFSAEDADSAISVLISEKHEGAFYVWSASEIDSVLGKSDAAVFDFAFGVEQGGNVMADPRHEFRGKNVLFRANDDQVTAKQFGRSVDEIRQILGASRTKLRESTILRPRPHRDDKTITAWNGLAISAFARAGRILNDDKYLLTAIHGDEFIRTNLYDAKSHTLYRRYRDGQRDIPGFADDYAFYIQAQLDLYESTTGIPYLELALDLQSRMDDLFADKTAGGYFSTVEDPTLLLRMKDDSDSAEPAASSVAALNLLRLAAMTDDKSKHDAATRTIASYADRLDRYPASLPQLLVALDFSLAKPKQIVIAGNPADPGFPEMQRELFTPYLPNRVILYADGGPSQRFLAQHLPFLKDMTPLQSKPTAYVCENYTCQLPTTDLKTFRNLLVK